MSIVRKTIGLAVLAAGIVLLVFAYQASHSMASDVSRAFTGNPTDRAMWLMIGGVACVVAGLGTVFLPFGPGRRR